MAVNRVLTTDEKEILRADSQFQKEVKWSVLNLFTYWKGQDGTSIPGGSTAANCKRWSRIRHFIANNNLSIADSPEVLNLYINQLIKDIVCWDSGIAQFIPSTCIAYLLDDSSQNHINTFETLAGKWIDTQIVNMPFD